MRRQDGVARVTQLYECGFDDNAIARLVARRIIERRYQGVYVSALSSLAPRGHLFAAILAFNDSAFLSHRTAAAMHGLRPLNVHAIEVTVVSGHTPPRRDGLIVHRTSRVPLSDEVRAIGHLRVASPARTLLDVAAHARPDELAHLIAEAARRRQLDLTRIDASIAHRQRAAGAAALTAALHRYDPNSAHPDKSGLERDFAQLLTQHPDIPEPLRNVIFDGRYELDFYWPDHGLAVELDGAPYHLTPDELERDRLKDAYLQRREIKVLRVTDFRFEHDRSGILDDLRAFTKRARAA